MIEHPLNPLVWLAELQTTLQNNLRLLFMPNPPKKWQSGRKNILLIQGYDGNFSAFYRLASALNQSKYKIHYLNLNTHLSIRKLASIYTKYISDSSVSSFILLSHSKGGLVAKEVLKEPTVAQKISRIITIASPHGGTNLAKLPIKEISDLHPKNVTQFNHNKIINIYPIFDNQVFPSKNLLLEDGQNIKIPIVGHTRILSSPKTIEVVKTILGSELYTARPRPHEPKV